MASYCARLNHQVVPPAISCAAPAHRLSPLPSGRRGLHVRPGLLRSRWLGACRAAPRGAPDGEHAASGGGDLRGGPGDTQPSGAAGRRCCGGGGCEGATPPGFVAFSFAALCLPPGVAPRRWRARLAAARARRGRRGALRGAGRSPGSRFRRQLSSLPRPRRRCAAAAAAAPLAPRNVRPCAISPTAARRRRVRRRREPRYAFPPVLKAGRLAPRARQRTAPLRARKPPQRALGHALAQVGRASGVPWRRETAQEPASPPASLCPLPPPPALAAPTGLAAATCSPPGAPVEPTAHGL